MTPYQRLTEDIWKQYKTQDHPVLALMLDACWWRLLRGVDPSYYLISEEVPLATSELGPDWRAFRLTLCLVDGKDHDSSVDPHTAARLVSVIHCDTIAKQPFLVHFEDLRPEVGFGLPAPSQARVYGHHAFFYPNIPRRQAYNVFSDVYNFLAKGVVPRI